MSDEWRRTKPLACPDADTDWMAKWAPPCPEGNKQRLLEILGFRLKGADYLQLRVVFRRRHDQGCHLIVDEHPDRIYVRAIGCLRQRDDQTDEADQLDYWPGLTEEIDCPSNWWLDEPLGERIVIDVDTGEELPLYIPRWGTGECSLYVPRPSGPLWPPEDMPRAH